VVSDVVADVVILVVVGDVLCFDVDVVSSVGVTSVIVVPVVWSSTTDRVDPGIVVSVVVADIVLSVFVGGFVSFIVDAVVFVVVDDVVLSVVVVEVLSFVDEAVISDVAADVVLSVVGDVVCFDADAGFGVGIHDAVVHPLHRFHVPVKQLGVKILNPLGKYEDEGGYLVSL